MIKVMTLFGTRPEAIKMAPLVKALQNDPEIDAITCVTAQHRQMLDQVLEVFKLKPEHDLDLMQHGQSLTDITSRVLQSVETVLKLEKPDLVLVHGDTTTTFAGALAAFYQEIPVGHVEAGLRSGNMYSPYPEEMNRRLTTRLSTIHFAATDGNVENLMKEGVEADLIYKTGNTVIDALKSVVNDQYVFDLPLLNTIDYSNSRVITVTAHRRENLGRPMENIFKAIRRIVETFDDVEVVFPMHMNPTVRTLAEQHLGSHPRIHKIEPLEYLPFANLINKSYLIMTDSGGIQEEAPALGKPVVVLRTETERPEAVDAGTVVIAGVEEEDVYEAAHVLLSDALAYNKMALATNPYGDGYACERIVNSIKEYFK